MPPPTFSQGGTNLATLAADPQRPDRLFATNGVQVVRSLDGGCSWSEVFVAENTSVRSIVISPGDDQVYLLLNRGDLVTASPADAPVMTSRDEGASWVRGKWSVPDGLLSTGPSWLGGPQDLVVSPEDPADAYLLMSRQLFSTTDAGRTWTPVSGLVDAGQTPFFQQGSAYQLEVHPADPQTLWLRGGPRLYRSTDGGRRWVPLDMILNSFEVVRSSGGSAWIYAFGSGGTGTGVSLSTDAGDSWTQIDAPANVTESAPYGRTGQIAISTVPPQDNPNSPRVYVRVQDSWVPIRLVPPRLDLLVAGGRAGGAFLYAATALQDPALATAGALYAFTPPGIPLTDLHLPMPDPSMTPPPLPPPPPQYCPIDEDLGSNDSGNLDPPRLAPERSEVHLAPGESREVPYDLSLPGKLPVDVYFLMDASGSMGSYLCGAANGAAEIARRLLDAGIDAWFGLGTYQDLGPQGTTGNCHSYRRQIDVQPLDEDFLVPSQTCGGTEPQMSALVQAATGEGQVGIEPDQQANFRKEAIPVIVHVSDEPQNLGEPHATLDEAVAALNSKEIRQVGIHPFDALARVPGEDTGLGSRASWWLRTIARETNALAVEPVDCDGDGLDDIAQGEPVVCGLSVLGIDQASKAMATAVSEMVMALVEERPVSVVERTKSGVVTRICTRETPRCDPAVYPAVNLRTNNDLGFNVTYACSPGQAGHTFPVTLDAQVRAATVASAEASVVCGTLPPPPPPPPVAMALPPIPVAVAPVPPMPVPAPGAAPAPAPLPAPANAPAPAQNPNLQSVANPNVNPAVAIQPQERPQVATVLVGSPVKEQFAHAMARVRDTHSRAQTVAFTLAAGGLSLASMFGYVVALRSRARPALSRQRGDDSR